MAIIRKRNVSKTTTKTTIAATINMTINMCNAVCRRFVVFWLLLPLPTRDSPLGNKLAKHKEAAA